MFISLCFASIFSMRRTIIFKESATVSIFFSRGLSFSVIMPSIRVLISLREGACGIEVLFDRVCIWDVWDGVWGVWGIFVCVSKIHLYTKRENCTLTKKKENETPRKNLKLANKQVSNPEPPDQKRRPLATGHSNLMSRYVVLVHQSENRWEMSQLCYDVTDRPFARRSGSKVLSITHWSESPESFLEEPFVRWEISTNTESVSQGVEWCKNIQ